jgi:hypothetical protein
VEVAAAADDSVVTISTYVFALIAVGACVAGSIFSFILHKVYENFKES